MAVEQDGAAAEFAEPQQHRGDGRFAGPVSAHQRNPPPGQQFEADPVQGRRAVRLITHGDVSQRDGEWPRWQSSRVARLTDGVGRVGNGSDPPCGDAGLIELDGRGGQGGDGLKSRERGEGEHRQRHPRERTGPGGRDAEEQDRP